MTKKKKEKEGVLQEEDCQQGGQKKNEAGCDGGRRVFDLEEVWNARDLFFAFFVIFVIHGCQQEFDGRLRLFRAVVQENVHQLTDRVFTSLRAKLVSFTFFVDALRRFLKVILGATTFVLVVLALQIRRHCVDVVQSSLVRKTEERG